jgi:hypothetical protein
MFKDKGSKTTKKKPIVDMKVNNYIYKYLDVHVETIRKVPFTIGYECKLARLECQI